MKKCFAAAAVVAVLGIVWFAKGTSHGQGFGTTIEAEPNAGGFTVYGPRREAGAAAEVRKIMGQLREAPEDKKAELTKQLETAVTKLFDEDLKAREADVAKLEERIKKLKDQLDRRRKAKSDIIQLQLRVLANEAEGLGFSRDFSLDDLSAQPGNVPSKRYGPLGGGAAAR